MTDHPAPESNLNNPNADAQRRDASGDSAPQQASAPAQPAPERPSGNDLSAEVSAQADAAMNAALDAQHAPKPAAPAPAGTDQDRPKAIRGPRVVEGGREYRTGTVISIGPEDIFIEFGPKELGVISRQQFTDEELPAIGEQFQVAVERFNADESLYICARPGTVQKAEWELLQPGQIVEATVTGHNKGGLELEIANHRAFMPASHVDIFRIEDLSQFVGQRFACEVIRVDRSGRGNITLSRRSVLKRERGEQLKKAKEALKEGDTIEVTVRKIMPFGAFCDMGGVDGLLHISDLSHDRVNKVEDVLKEGQTLPVKVLKLDWEGKRHSLGLKQLTEHPFATATKELEPGSTVQGRITKLLEFGAFCEIAPGVEGLIHISELAWKRVMKTSDVVRPNQVVDVKILDIDPDKAKISLSIKQTTEAPAGDRGKPQRGRGDEDTRKPEEILKETPALRRLREQGKQKLHEKGVKDKSKGLGGLGSSGGLGVGLGDLKLGD
ncbi:MAG: 30S ribosomal protein S1 [Phycisphaerales bacterium]